jgi:hypothetical protein
MLEITIDESFCATLTKTYRRGKVEVIRLSDDEVIHIAKVFSRLTLLITPDKSGLVPAQAESVKEVLSPVESDPS